MDMIRRLVHLGWLWGFILFTACHTPGFDIYVSPEGNDAAAGTLTAPVKSLHRAAELAREKAGTAPLTIYLSGGRYALTEPLVLGPGDGGKEEAPVRWEALPGETPVVSGGIPLDQWTLEEDGSWSAELPGPYQGTFRSLYVNGKMATRARHPNGGYLRVGKAGEDLRTHFHFNETDIPELSDAEGIELVFLHDWSVTRIPVKSVDWTSRQLTAVDSIGARLDFFTMTHWEEHPRYYLENAQEFCDQAGEWYADFQAGKIRYRPFPEDTIEKTTGFIPVAEKLLVMQGKQGQPLEHISFAGIAFEHTAWTLPEKGYCGVQACMFSDRSANSQTWSKVPAAIELDQAQYCSFRQCTVRNTGGSGLWIRQNCLGCEITESHFHDISGNGICIGEGNDRLVEGQAWWKSKPEEATAHVRVSHTVIERCGRQFHGAVGIWCGLVAHTVIEHNEIRDLPYTGVSVGWMWTPEPTPCRENTIHANHIHHIMAILSDGGGIYSLGLQPGSRITKNLIHHVQVNAGRAESNGMFLDEGTKELLIQDNIVYDIAKSPLRFHKAYAPTRVSNNVLVCRDDIPPIAYNNTRESDIEKSGNTILIQSSEPDMARLQQLIEDFLPD